MRTVRRVLLFCLLVMGSAQSYGAEQIKPLIGEENSYDAIFGTKPVTIILPELKNVASNLAKNKILRAKFNQLKKIAVLRRPLLSKGQMLYAEELGLYWSIESPFASHMRLSKNKVEQKGGSGDWKIVADGSPEVGKITSVFLALLTGDVELLSQHFTLYFVQNDGFWLIGLQPKSELLKKVMTKALLKGDTLVQEIITWEANGDSNHIQFFDSRIEPVVLTAAEKEFFQGR